MGTNQHQSQTKTETQSINLIDGKFTPSQAADIINVMLDKKINYHKVQVVTRMEGCFEDECVQDNSRLKELIQERERAQEIFREARASGKRLKISSLIHLEMVD